MKHLTIVGVVVLLLCAGGTRVAAQQVASSFDQLAVLVKPGDTVVAGQTIARSGASGKATGPHLHFEVLREGESIDPRGTW